MWDLIVSVPDHCLSFYFVLVHFKLLPFHCGFSIIIGSQEITSDGSCFLKQN